MPTVADGVVDVVMVVVVVLDIGRDIGTGCIGIGVGAGDGFVVRINVVVAAVGVVVGVTAVVTIVVQLITDLAIIIIVHDKFSVFNPLVPLNISLFHVTGIRVFIIRAVEVEFRRSTSTVFVVYTAHTVVAALAAVYSSSHFSTPVATLGIL